MFFKELSSRNDDKIKPKFFLKTSQPNLKSFTNFDNPLILEKVNFDLILIDYIPKKGFRRKFHSGD